MKLLKSLALVAVLCAGLSSLAHAHFTGPTIQDVHPDNPEATLAAAKDFFGNDPPFNCIDRVDGASPGATIHSGEFTITFNSNKSATISWTNLSDNFAGIYVKGGSQGGQFYGVSADEIHDSGTGEIVFAPNTGKGLKHPADISHIDFFCSPGEHNTVPDGGATAMLLGTALAGVAVTRRFMKR
ncbi:MAG: VPDSG-CTERM sorting domain-containing protein [Chthoniobacterales bacterium]